MFMVVPDVNELTPGVWSAAVPPAQVKLLGTAKASVGPRSVVLVSGAVFDADTGMLRFDLGDVTVLNLGTSPALLAVATSDRHEMPTGAEEGLEASGSGDREFLSLVERELNGVAQEAAKRILSEVRQRYPGDLQRGQRHNFKNTPDNFWYVIVQPRAQSLSITVRGAPDRFAPSTLELKDDRPGYTRFSLKHLSEVKEALRVIEASKRKGR